MIMKFNKRTTAPSRTDKHFINYGRGGYNTCITINQQSGYVLPNCVGYTQGRLLELRGENKINWKLPACNAEDWYDKAKENGLQVGSTPKLGAVVVWRAGNTHNSADGAGHVAIVEEIKANGDIVVSQSAYGGQEFYMSTITKASGYMYAANRPLVGFVYAGVEFEEDKSEPEQSTTSVQAGIKVELKNVQAYASESSLGSYGLRSGTYYTWDGNPKNGRIRLTNASSKVGVAGQVSFWVELADIGLSDDTGIKIPAAGTMYILNNAPVYGTEKGPSIGKRSGTYYVWDSKVRNGRVRMTNVYSKVGVAGQVSFWIEVNKLI